MRYSLYMLACLPTAIPSVNFWTRDFYPMSQSPQVSLPHPHSLSRCTVKFCFRRWASNLSNSLCFAHLAKCYKIGDIAWRLFVVTCVMPYVVSLNNSQFLRLHSIHIFPLVQFAPRLAKPTNMSAICWFQEKRYRVGGTWKMYHSESDWNNTAAQR